MGPSRPIGGLGLRLAVSPPRGAVFYSSRALSPPGGPYLERPTVTTSVCFHAIIEPLESLNCSVQSTRMTLAGLI